MTKHGPNDEFAQTPVFSPTAEEMRRIEQRAHYERAKASREAVRYVARKVANVLIADRAADKVRIKTAA